MCAIKIIHVIEVTQKIEALRTKPRNVQIQSNKMDLPQRIRLVLFM